jgi:hypothetical protein
MKPIPDVQKALSQTRNVHGSSARMDSLSKHFLGLPYIANSLIGSASTPETFTYSLKAFDCVTYMETVLALAGSRSVKEFASSLKGIRYDRGRVDWRRRNHYMTGWIRNNVRSGWVRRVHLEGPRRQKTRMLDLLPGLPVRKQRFTCTPKGALSKAVSQVRSGDLIFFASTRFHNDVFHCGIVIRQGDTLLLRHASRSQGAVVEQTLSSFLKQNRMAGVILTRPAERNQG